MSNFKHDQSSNYNYIAYSSSNTHYAFVVLSSLSLITNSIDIVFYNLSSRKKQRNKSSSIEKMLFFLAIIEELISIYWLINSTIFKNEETIKEYYTKCRIVGSFGLFLYNMEWVMISSIIFQLRKIISNPVNGVLNADSQMKIYMIIDVIVAVGSTIIGVVFQIEGISPINTCFIQGTHEPNIAVWVLISIPLVNIFFGLYHIYRIIFSKATRNDIEMLMLFSKYMIYISCYLLCSLFFFIIYLFDSIVIIPQNIPFQWFIFISSLIICVNSIICFFVRYIQKYFRVDLFKKSLSRRKMKEYVYDLKDLANIPLTDANDTEFTWLEKKVITNFMRDVFASISYCLTKNLVTNKNKIIDSYIDKNYCLESRSYVVNLDLIENDELVKDIIGKDEMIKNAEYLKIKVVEYAPKIFSLLRKIDNIDEVEMIYSLLPSKNQIGINKSQGRSGNFFINTDDHNYIIKTINYEDVELIREILLEQLAKHVKLSPSSLIGRIYGLFKIILPNDEEVIMLLMRNVFGVFNEDNILCKFDLKGSKLNRKENVEKDALENMVMKDLNFNEIEHSLLLTQEYKERLIQNAKKDAHMLSSLGIMDYSLLVVKLSFNKDEIIALFGPGHKKKIEHDVHLMLENTSNLEDISNSKKLESFNNFFDDEVKTEGEIGYDINQLRFNLNKVSYLKKHMFPSLQYHIVYIAAIIDFFQLYNMRKNLETKFKLIKALKEDISSIPPNEYMQRFINNLLKITDSEGLLKNKDILSRDNI